MISLPRVVDWKWRFICVERSVADRNVFLVLRHRSFDDPEVGTHRSSLRRQTGFEENGVLKGNHTYVDAKPPGKIAGCGLILLSRITEV